MCGSVCLVHLVDDSGRVLDAEYLVEADGSHLALIMESRSGMSGRRAPRNPDYNRVLTVLLARLGALKAVLVDALVDSRHTQDLGLPEADRRLILAQLDDLQSCLIADVQQQSAATAPHGTDLMRPSESYDLRQRPS
jgi:hypothetical protein